MASGARLDETGTALQSVRLLMDTPPFLPFFPLFAGDASHRKWQCLQSCLGDLATAVHAKAVSAVVDTRQGILDGIEYFLPIRFQGDVTIQSFAVTVGRVRGQMREFFRCCRFVGHPVNNLANLVR